jgi:glycosyltransferase involved in cell wall biosynthesis
MSKKILVAAGLYPPDIGGPATYAKLIEERLPQHDISVTIMAFGQVRHLPKIFRHINYAYRLWKLADQHDAIYALDAVSVGLPAALVAKFKRKPMMVRLGGDYAWEQGSQRFNLGLTLDEYTKDRRKANWQTKILARVQDFVVASAVLVIVPSNYLKNIVATWRGVNAENIKVVYSALFPLLVNDSKADLRAQLNYSNFTIITAGRLVPWKGFSTLLKIIADIKDELPNITLVIAGDGPLKKSLEQEIKDLDLTKEVRLVGSLSKEALGASIKAADVFVLNTGYEGLSHQLIEVMDLEVPIITTRVGGNPELIENRKSGLLVDYDDHTQLKGAIMEIYGNESLRTDITMQAKAKVDDFRPEKVMVKLVDAINDIFSPTNS